MMSSQADPPESFHSSKPRAYKIHLNHAPESSVNAVTVLLIAAIY